MFERWGEHDKLYLLRERERERKTNQIKQIGKQNSKHREEHQAKKVQLYAYYGIKYRLALAWNCECQVAHSNSYTISLLTLFHAYLFLFIYVLCSLVRLSLINPEKRKKEREKKTFGCKRACLPLSLDLQCATTYKYIYTLIMPNRCVFLFFSLIITNLSRVGKTQTETESGVARVCFESSTTCFAFVTIVGWVAAREAATHLHACNMLTRYECAMHAIQY